MWKTIRLPLLFLFFVLAEAVSAQSDSVPPPKPLSKYKRIAMARKELLAAFLGDDPAGAALWRDSLTRLEDRNYVGLAWDERWLLYYWEETYGNLFEEAAQFDEQERDMLALKQQAPDDSLFEWIDHVLYERRYDLFQNISKGFLTEEERLFATLQLEYLLRLNTDKIEWNTKIDAFLKRFPSSRFAPYLKTTKTKVSKPGKSAFNFDILFVNGNWRNELDRTLNPLYGADVGLAIWKNRWNVGLHFTIGGQKLNRDVVDGLEVWLKGDKSNYYAPELELGYDFINNKKMRVFPSLGAGLSFLRSPAPNEEDETPLPDYYYDFRYFSGHLLAALTTEIKFPIKDADEAGITSGAYNAVRLRLGYRRMYLDRENPAFEGDQLFFAVGYSFFAYNQAK